MKTAHEQGIEWEACDDAQKLRDAFPPETTQKEWFERYCPPRGDWLLWNLKHLSNSELSLVRLQLVELTKRAAKRAKEYVREALVVELPLSEYSEDRFLYWADKAERSIRAASWGSARVAVWSAMDAAHASAWASKAAVLATKAARTAAEKAEKAELKKQAEDIRELIPIWPVRGK